MGAIIQHWLLWNTAPQAAVGPSFHELLERAAEGSQCNIGMIS